MTMTLDLDELKRLHAKATAGPWRASRHAPNYVDLDRNGKNETTVIKCFNDSPRAGERSHDAPYIAALHNAFPELIERLERAEADLWRPIETAPKDGTLILATNGRATEVVSWMMASRHWWTGGYTTEGKDDFLLEASHWCPMPAPPAQKPSQ